MNKFSFRNAVLLTMLSLSVGISACKRTEPAKPPAPASQAPAQAEQPIAPPAAAPAPAVEQPSATSAAVGVPGATTGRSKGGATSRSKHPPVLRAVRTARQAGFDRLAFEFDTAGLPAWDVEYIDKPVLDCGSGEPVKVAGDAFLQIRFTGAQARSAKGRATSGPRRRVLAHAVARELVRTCDFEGEVTWVVGLVRPNAYTARIMSGPSRLVIDIAH